MVNHVCQRFSSTMAICSDHGQIWSTCSDQAPPAMVDHDQIKMEMMTMVNHG